MEASAAAPDVPEPQGDAETRVVDASEEVENETAEAQPEAAPPPPQQQQPAPQPAPQKQQSPLPLALGALGVAGLVFVGTKLFGKKEKARRLDPYGAFMEYIELAAAPNPAPPAAPLALSGLRFAWKDMCAEHGPVL